MGSLRFTTEQNLRFHEAVGPEIRVASEDAASPDRLVRKSHVGQIILTRGAGDFVQHVGK